MSGSVTFLVLCYNQERFIEEAMTSALLQECAPLHVLVSDDASTDGTFDVVRRVEASYRGPHRLTVRRNERNLGLAEHFHLCCRLSESEWIICGAGDDISESNRAARLMEAAARRPNLAGVGSAWIDIDAAGKRREQPHRVMDRLLPSSRWFRISQNQAGYSSEATRNQVLSHLIEGQGFLLGAAAAWRTRLVTEFPPMLPGTPEDFVLSMRASVEGGVFTVPEPLLRYRKHSSNMWSAAAVVEDDKQMALAQRRREILERGLLQCDSDLDCYLSRGTIDRDLHSEAKEVLRLRRSLSHHEVGAGHASAAAAGAFLMIRGIRTLGSASGSAPKSRVRRWILFVAYQLSLRIARRFVGYQVPGSSA